MVVVIEKKCELDFLLSIESSRIKNKETTLLFAAPFIQATTSLVTVQVS